jgi:hypothetical protein
MIYSAEEDVCRLYTNTTPFYERDSASAGPGMLHKEQLFIYIIYICVCVCARTHLLVLFVVSVSFTAESQRLNASWQVVGVQKVPIVSSYSLIAPKME